MTLLRTVARPMLASMFVYGGLNSVRHAPMMADRARPVTDRIVPLLQRVSPQAPTDAATLVRMNGAIHLIAGAALATGRFPRLSSLVLAATLVPTTAAGHPFWEEDDPGARANQTIHLLKNVSMMGGLLMASLDPDPHKKILPRRAIGAVATAAGAVGERVSDAAGTVGDTVSDLRP